MRTTFIQELCLQARLHPEIFLVVGDLGYSVVEPFADEFPDRFLNAGIAEQNMTGVAAGLAAEGYHVFTYSIANFPTFRCLEQIRNDIAYHRLPVTVVSVGAGLAYGSLGYSHHAVQDIGILRQIPEMSILSPADPGEARACTQWLAAHPCPSYLRIGKAGEARLHETGELHAGPLELVPGTGDCAIVATGSVLKSALDALPALAEKGIMPAVYSLPMLQPLCAADLAPLARYRTVFSLEEHLLAGGLASLLRENLPEGVRLRAMALPDSVLGVVGGQKALWARAGLDASSVASCIEQSV